VEKNGTKKANKSARRMQQNATDKTGILAAQLKQSVTF
jgi:hypothetical protein